MLVLEGCESHKLPGYITIKISLSFLICKMGLII